MINKKEKRITNTELLKSINRSFSKVEKKIDTKVDELAIMTKNGFDRMDKKFDQHDKIFNVMIKEIRTIHEDNKYFRQSISSLNSDGLSYDRKITDLDIRVEKLEKSK